MYAAWDTDQNFWISGNNFIFHLLSLGLLKPFRTVLPADDYCFEGLLLIIRVEWTHGDTFLCDLQ